MPETFQGSFLCLQGLILIPGTCSNEWANMSLGQEAENTRCLHNVVPSLLFALICFLHCLAFFLPHSWHQESKSLLDFKYKMVGGGGSFLRKLFILLVSRDGERERETTSFQASVTSCQTSSQNWQTWHSRKGSRPSKTIFPSTVRINCHQAGTSQRAYKECSL